MGPVLSLVRTSISENSTAIESDVDDDVDDDDALCLKNKETGQLNVSDLFSIQETYLIGQLRCTKYVRRI